MQCRLMTIFEGEPMKKIRNFVRCLLCMLEGVFCIMLLTCTNFLNGAEIKEQIEEEIAYAKAPKFEIRCAVDSNEYGQIYPQTVTVIKGETFSLEFTKNPAAIFNGWVCVDQDTGEILEDAVIFSDERNVDSRYTVNAKLNCEKSNLIIKPFCYLEKEAVPLPPTIKTVRVAKTREDALNGTNLIPLEDFVYYAKKSNFGDSAEAVNKNIDDHHVKSVWFYMEATDAGSGVGSISVKETFLRQTDGTELLYQSYFTTTYLNDKSNSIADVFELNFKCPIDGVVRLNFIATDRAGESAVSDFSVDLVKDTVFEMPVCCLKNTIDFPDETTGMVDYNFIIPTVDKYTSFITDMDGTEHKEGFGAPYNYYTSNEYIEYIGRLAKLVSVETGYSEDSLSPVPSESLTFCEGLETYIGLRKVKGDMYRCKIRADSNRDTYIRIVASDMIGNEYSYVNLIPRAVSVVSCEEAMVTHNYWGALTGIEYPSEGIPGYILKFDYQPTGVFAFWVKQNEDGSIDHDVLKGGEKDFRRFEQENPLIIGKKSLEAGHFLRYKESDSGLNLEAAYISDFEDGIYNIYSIAIYGNYTFSCVGKPFTVYKGVEKPDLPPITDSDLPSSFTVAFDPPVLNAGKRSVHIRYPENFTPNPNLMYKVHYRHDANPSIGIQALDDYAAKLDFEVPTHYTSYTFSIVAYNLAGDSRESSFTASETETFYDNVVPESQYKWVEHWYCKTPNGLIYNYDMFCDDHPGLFYDDYSGLYENENGKISVQYFYSSNGINPSEIDWSSDRVRITEYDGGDYIAFPFDGNRGNYLYFKVHDKNGNYLVDYDDNFIGYRGVVSYDVSPVTFSHKNNTFTVAGASSCLDDSNWGAYIVAQYFDDGKWKATRQMNDDYGYDDMEKTSESEKTFSYSPTFTDSERDCFVRLQPWTDVGYGEFFAPVYIYPKYYTQNLTCDLKNFMQGSMGLAVLADNPVLVHTFYSTMNLGNTVEDWLYGGIETGTVQKSKSFTYGNEYLAEIPEGKYYTTIIHFADGTTVMTGVNKK